jgi:hypothetical protein
MARIRFVKQLTSDLETCRVPVQITSRGLNIGGMIQTFTWEGGIQRRFALYVARKAKCVVNVGYGLGFAHRAFEQTKGIPLYLIEANKFVLKRCNRKTATAVYLGKWEHHLPSVLQETSTLFFDAFPIAKSFSYQPQQFRTYIEPLLNFLAEAQWDRAFFIAFDAAPILFRTSGTLSVRRVLSAPIGNPKPFPHLARMSLYEVVKK